MCICLFWRNADLLTNYLYWSSAIPLRVPPRRLDVFTVCKSSLVWDLKIEKTRSLCVILRPVAIAHVEGQSVHVSVPICGLWDVTWYNGPLTRVDVRLHVQDSYVCRTIRFDATNHPIHIIDVKLNVMKVEYYSNSPEVWYTFNSS